MHIQEITSNQNPVIQSLKRLKNASARKETGLALIEGRVMIEEALRSDIKIREVLTDQPEEHAELLRALEETGARLYASPRRCVEAVSLTKTPQGILASIELPAPVSPDCLGDYVLLLEDVQDPGNVGTLIRSALAAGCTSALLTPRSADPFGPKALRATMGAAFRLPLRVVDTGEITQILANHACIGTTLDGKDIYSAEFIRPLCLVVGNEACGLSPEMQDFCSQNVSLTMRGGVNSLNAAVAGSIFLFHIAQGI